MTDSSANLPEQAANMDTIGRIAELIGGDPMARLDTDMKHVLDALAELGARPLEQSTPASARRQPKTADAIAGILALQTREPADDGVTAEDIAIETGDEASLPGRLYRPLGPASAGSIR
jgi:acetyl esterase